MNLNDINSNYKYLVLYYIVIIIIICVSENIVVYLFWLVNADGVQSSSATGEHSHVEPTNQFAGGGSRRSQFLFGTSSEL